MNMLLYDWFIFIEVKIWGVLNYYEIVWIIVKFGCKCYREKNFSYNKDFLWLKY